jgi:hypothetical protein
MLNVSSLVSKFQGVSTPQFMMFNTSCTLLQLPNHPLYPGVDWGKVGGGYYAVVDPMDENGILYLSDKEYKIQVRVSVSQDSQLSVLARPGDTQMQGGTPDKTSIDPTKQNSPTKEELGLVVRKNYPIAERPYAPSFIGWYYSELEKFRRETDCLVEPSDRNLMALVLHWGLDLNIRAGGQLKPQPALDAALLELGKSLVNILVTRGRTALILKMKNTLFFINRWLAGSQNDNPFLLGEPVGLARSGLPRILPIYLRRAIGSKNTRLIRVVQSIFKAYSALDGPHVDCDLVSVTGSCPPLDAKTLEAFERFCAKEFWPVIVRNYAKQAGRVGVLKPRFRPNPRDAPFYPSRGGPNHSVGILGAPLDALAWAASPRMYPRMWFEHVGDARSVALFDQVLYSTQLARNSQLGKSIKSKILRNWDFQRELDVGKLAFLPEAAGKVRTIAIVDYWTQRAMKPVHDWMMSVLSVFPTDGTFNQEEALRTYSRSTSHVAKHYSIDLKSATDMIPIELYRALFKGIWKEETVELWIALLTDRWFRIPSDGEDFQPLVQPRLRGTLVEYNRGQPMGTLSSWASMALVHHALELFSAKEAGLDPVTFQDYRVLGDDNVTGNCLVAASYRTVCSLLQIPISDSKTLEGKLFVFASQVYLDGVNISPMSLKEELSVKTCAQRVEMALRAVSRGWLGDKPTTARLLRLLCRKRDYLRSVKEFAKGKLGRVAQAALISAFGLGSKILSRMGVQESGFLPFLLSIENKVQVLARDENQLSDRNLAVFNETETLISIAMLRRIIAMLKKDLSIAETAAIRWSNWRARMESSGVVPLPHELSTNNWQIVSGRDEQWLSLPQPTDSRLSRGTMESWSRAIWPVLLDFYDPWFESPVDNPRTIGLLIKKAALGRANSVRPRRGRGRGVPPMKELPVRTIELKRPLLIEKISEVLYFAEAAMEKLVKVDPESPDLLASPMTVVYETLRMQSVLPRLPTFDKLECLVPDRTPKEVDGMKLWVRQMKTFSEVLTHLDLFTDFSVKDMPNDVGLSPLEEALLSTTPEVVTVSSKRKSTSPSAASD